MLIEGPAILIDELVKQLETHEPYYAIACEEHAPSTGTRHFHVLIMCRKTVTARRCDIITIKGIQPHIEKIRNNIGKVIEYIKKNGMIAEMNHENCPVKKTAMNKEEKAKLMLECDLKEAFLKGILGPVEVLRADKLRKLFDEYSKPDDYAKKLVLWFRGESGEGKSRMAVDIAKKYNLDYWISNDSLKWFDGYHGQELAILDDFRRGMLGDWSFLLRLLDGYPLLVQVKGAHVKWCPKIIVITSPGTPEDAFQWVTKDGDVQNWDHQEQLERRITYEDERQVYEFPLWDEEKTRLMKTIEDFLGINDQAMVEEELSMSPILPEPSQIDEA